MSKKSEVCLKNFFIYNSTLGLKEGQEEKKILFYYPSDSDIETQIKDVGLTEAIIQFANTFSKNEEVQSFHTQKTSHLYYEPEKNFWMVMTLNVPYEIKTKDKMEYNEYHGYDIQDTIYKTILKQSYKMFRLFMGTFLSQFIGSTLDSKSENLKLKLNSFYTKYILTMKLQNYDILNVVQTIEYVPLSRLIFLRVHNFMELIETTFPIVKFTIFLYNDQIVWSKINKEDLYSIHEYLITTLFPRNLSSELKGGSMPKRASFSPSGYGGFITNTIDSDCVKPPKMYILKEKSYNEYLLLAYKAMSGVICMFIDDKENLTEDFYQEMHNFLGPQLSKIASEISEYFSEVSTPILNQALVSAEPKFLSFNTLTKQHQQNVHFGHRLSIQSFIMNLITDLYDNDHRTNYTTSEVTIKTLNDFWIVKKYVNSRYVFVILNKNSTLLEISEDVKKIYDQYIKNIFFN